MELDYLRSRRQDAGKKPNRLILLAPRYLSYRLVHLALLYAQERDIGRLVQRWHSTMVRTMRNAPTASIDAPPGSGLGIWPLTLQSCSGCDTWTTMAGWTQIQKMAPGCARSMWGLLNGAKSTAFLGLGPLICAWQVSWSVRLHALQHRMCSLHRVHAYSLMRSQDPVARRGPLPVVTCYTAYVHTTGSNCWRPFMRSRTFVTGVMSPA